MLFRSVHAVAAALVQVTNTASNPVVAQGIDKQAGNMVHLTCDVLLSGANLTCGRVAPDLSFTSNYTVPAGESLVITAIDVRPTNEGSCPGSYDIGLTSQSQLGNFLQLTTTNAIVTTHFTYPSGLVIGAGITPTWFGISETLNTSAPCSAVEVVNMFGYLTAA